MTLSRISLFVFFCLFLGSQGHAQTLSEQLLRQSPKLSVNMGYSFESNLQKTDTYQNSQSSALLVSPRYRLTDTYTLIATTGFSQSLTREQRSDMINTSVGVTRNPISIGGVMDLRPTFSLVAPTNAMQRQDDSLRGAARLTGIAYFRTRSAWILGFGGQAQLNNHQFSVSAINGANLQTIATGFATVGYSLGKFQLVAQGSQTNAWTYRGTKQAFFGLSQSITYIPTRKMSFSIGHTNQGNVLARDGVRSNVALFNSRTSVVFFGANYNYQ